MELTGFEALDTDSYLKKYRLTYREREREKKYEIVSRHNYRDVSEVGTKIDGCSMVVFQKGKLLLLHEFRLGINRAIYNLCAGMVKEGESMKECCARELMEETGLSLVKILGIFPPSFASVAISDVRTQIAFVEAKGKPKNSDKTFEPITSKFYTKNQVKKMLKSCEFSSRAQMMAYFFSEGLFEGFFEKM